MSEGRSGSLPRVALACALGIAAGLLPSAALAASATSSSAQAAQLDAQLQQLQQQMSAGRQRLAAAQATAAAAERRRGFAADRVQSQTNYIDGLEAQIATAQQQADGAASDLGAADATLAADRQRADDGLRMLYEGGTGRFLGVLLGSESFSEFLTRFHFLQALFASDVDMLRREQAARAAATARQASLGQQEASLRALAAQAADAMRQLSLAAQAAGTAANAAQAQEAQQADAVTAESAAAARASAELANLTVQYNRAHGKLVFDWPLPAPHILTAPFGPRVNPITHQHEIHTGVDIADPVGTPIHAAAAGVVVFAGWQTGYGMVVILYHGKVGGHTYYTLYAHQSKFAVQLHQDVQQGQVIGYVGLTGWTTGPHLHFEIRVDGQPVNPVPYLPPTGIEIYY